MKSIIKLVKSVVYSSLLAFVLYAFLAFILAALLEKSENKHYIVSWWMVLIYQIAFFIIHETDRTETHAKNDRQFTYLKELKAYFFAEGKYLLLIYGICVTIVEISMVVTNNAPQNPFALIFCMNFPLMPYLPVIIRSIVSLLLCMIGAHALALLRSFIIRVYK